MRSTTHNEPSDDALNFLLRRSLMDADAELERRIEASSLQFLAAKNPSERRKLWHRHKKLIASRSQRQVERMEKERGIYTEIKS